MAYVALLRAQKLENFYIISFEPGRLNCDPKAVFEYNRLKNRFIPDSPLIEFYNKLPEKYNILAKEQILSLKFSE